MTSTPLPGAPSPLRARCYATAKGYTVSLEPPTPTTPSNPTTPRYFATLAAAMAWLYSPLTPPSGVEHLITQLVSN
jgi:hypothetical protein